MEAKEILTRDGEATYLVLYRVKKQGGVGSPDARRARLTEVLSTFNGDKAGRFFEEADHISTSAWIVRVSRKISPNDLVQSLEKDAKLTAGIDYLWAIEVAEPINEAHMTRNPMP